MAIRESTSTRPITKGDHTILFVWAGLLSGDSGRPIQSEGHADRSIQFVGTIAAGARVQLQGSNDGVTWQVLTDHHGNDLEFTSPGLASISEVVAFMRPEVIAGSPTVTAHLLVRRHSRA